MVWFAKDDYHAIKGFYLRIFVHDVDPNALGACYGYRYRFFIAAIKLPEYFIFGTN